MAPPFSPRFLFRTDKSENGEAYQRRRVGAAGLPEGLAPTGSSRGSPPPPGSPGWRRIALLILAVTIHNIPGEPLPRAASHLPTGGGWKGVGAAMWEGLGCDRPSVVKAPLSTYLRQFLFPISTYQLFP